MSDPNITTLGLPVGVQGADGANGTQGTTARDAQRDQIKRLAQEFEAMLMTQMLRDMRRSMLSDESTDGGLGRETMTDTMDVELGRALSNVGGFGLSNVLLKALERSLGTTQSSPATPASVAPPTATAPGACAAIPAATPAVGQERDRTPDNPELKIPDGQVTSGYGWRRDPFTGAPQFHKGIDVAARYGQDIPAVAAGHVVFAGHQGTYGTTVVVDHGTGQQTRYAHLSAAGVKAGDQVETGQVIGKAGASGRTTGTHVHFEVMTDGQATDPADHH
jgi:murein DD-endopeptidase MepM/ murein hydrolase activator NlpD